MDSSCEEQIDMLEGGEDKLVQHLLHEVMQLRALFHLAIDPMTEEERTENGQLLELLGHYEKRLLEARTRTSEDYVDLLNIGRVVARIRNLWEQSQTFTAEARDFF